MALSSFLGAFWLSLDLAPDPLAGPSSWDYTVTLADRHGRALREILPPPQNRRERLDLSLFSPILVKAVIIAEDKRFWRHPGVDPLAMIRAAWINLKSGKVKSGGSTITMQVARLSRNMAPGPRTIKRKLMEIWLALIIERKHAKDEILAFYLNSAPAGGHNLGFEAAARAWLGKGAGELSPSEAALLAAIPASPGTGRTLAPTPKILARRASILDRLEKTGELTSAEARRARSEPLFRGHRRRPFLAPHFTAEVIRRLGDHPAPTVFTTLDFDLQEKIEKLTATTVARYKSQGLSQAAVVVISLPKREVLAWVGSADFFGLMDGQIDGVLTPRQPGSALKPLIYALGLETGEIAASSLLADEPFDYPASGGFWRPANYSGKSHGLVSARVALASSLNLPAVNLTMRLGVDKVLARLRDLGLESLSRDEEFYGLGLALGDGEVSLLSLTSAYAAMADNGRLAATALLLPASYGSLKPELQKALAEPPREVMSRQAAYIVSDILADPLARVTGFGTGGPLRGPWPIPVKTGTSKNFRDNWCLGFTSDYVIGVWAGNFQAQPMNKVSGVTGAGHLWRATANLLTAGSPPAPRAMPPGVITGRVCPVTGLLAGPDCPNSRQELFIEGLPLPPECDHDKARLSFASVGSVLETRNQRLRENNLQGYNLEEKRLASLTERSRAADKIAGREELKTGESGLRGNLAERGAMPRAEPSPEADRGNFREGGLSDHQEELRIGFQEGFQANFQSDFQEDYQEDYQEDFQERHQEGYQEELSARHPESFQEGNQAHSETASLADGRALQAKARPLQENRSAPRPEAEPERRFLSPRSGDVFAWDPGLPAEYQRLRAVIEGGSDPGELVVLLDGLEISRQSLDGRGRAAAMVPLRKGRQTLEAKFLSKGLVVGSHSIWYDVR